MVRCEICGKEVEKPIKILVENTKILVCNNCKKYGLVEEDKKQIKKIKKEIKKDEQEEFFNNNLLGQERINKGLSLEKLALILNEKKSLIKKIESGDTNPSQKLIYKFKKFFGKDFIVKIKKGEIKTKQTKNLTIGDIIKIKK